MNPHTIGVIGAWVFAIMCAQSRLPVLVTVGAFAAAIWITANGWVLPG